MSRDRVSWEDFKAWRMEASLLSGGGGTGSNGTDGGGPVDT